MLHFEVTSAVTKGRHKKLFFFIFGQKGGGGFSANPKNPYQKILRFFFTIFDQKLSFLIIFFIKGGGLPQSKKSLSEKMR